MRKYIIILMIPLLLAVACLKSPFGTRDSEEPAGASGTWETPATPEVLMLNLLYAYNEMNIQNYQLCLADEFVFSSTQDSIEAEGEGNGYLYRYWDKSVEVSGAENMFTSFADNNIQLFMSLSSSTDYPDSIGDSLAVMYRNYIIYIIETDSESSDTTQIEGLASFSASRSLFYLWSIYMWQEIPAGGTDYNWANLKAEYRN